MELRKKNIEKFARHLSKLRDVFLLGAGPGYKKNCFSMRGFEYGAGGPACNAGHCQAIFGESISGALGLTMEQETDACYPQTSEANYTAKPGTQGYITAKRSAAMFRHLARTGKVEWK